MFCNNCGKELNKDDRFCSRCGSKVQLEEKIEFEEVVFNPPFKLEAESAGEELHQEQSPEKKKYATIDFSWDISDYPSAGPTKEARKTQDVVFDWSASLGTIKAQTRKPGPISEEKPEEVAKTAEEIQIDLDKEAIEMAKEPEVEKAMPKAGDEFSFLRNEPNFRDEIILPPATDEKTMPQGNGITVEDFLEELKNHKSREERAEEEAQKEAEEALANGEEIKAAEEKKGFFSFLRGAFTEKEEAQENEAAVEETAEEVVEEIAEEVKEETPFEEITIPPAVEKPEPEEVSEEEPETEALAEEEPEVETPDVEEVVVIEEIASEEGETEEIATNEIVVEEVEVEEQPEEIVEEASTPANEINDFLPPDQRTEDSYQADIDATRIVDKFYTFNKKNVEFQQLLDQEYEKIRGEKSLEEIKAEIRQSNKEAGENAKIALEQKELAKAKGENKRNWDEIFGDEPEEPKKKSSKASKVLTATLLIIAIISGGSYGIVKLFPSSQPAIVIESLCEKVMALFGPSQEEEEPQETVKDFINNQLSVNENIGKVKYDAGLEVDMNRDYSTKGVKDSQPFINSSYVNEDGEKVSYGDEITKQIIKRNSDLAGTLEGQKMDTLSIGKFRVSEKGFFVITSYQLENTEDGTTEDCIELVFLSIEGNQVEIKNIEEL